MHICVTGSNGLIGSTTVEHLLKKGHQVTGIDNDMRQTFFGKEGSTQQQYKHLKKLAGYTQNNVDIRQKDALFTIFKKKRFDAVIHCAAQPSHDKAKDIPFLDFEVNALGTLNLLEATRQHCPKATFIFTSTNKVYGDNPNKLEFLETSTRFTFKNKKYKGIDESLSLDHCTHSLFGVSKLAADMYVQEYGQYFGINTAVLRLGCVTGSVHASVKLHGFLSYLVKSLVHSHSYEIIGYKGKQVRDQIHAEDVASAMVAILKKPRKASVYNLGGGQENNASILELIKIISKKIKILPTITYLDQPRIGDHICYISDTTLFQSHYPNWHLNWSLERIIDDLIAYEQKVNAHP